MLWNLSYETGVAAIDKQNFDLMSRLNAMANPDTNKARFEQLIKFEQTVAKYFEQEQAMHKECNYHDAEMHRYSHASYLKRLHRIGRDYVNRGATLENEMYFLKHTVESLKNHIMNQDKSFAEFYINKIAKKNIQIPKPRFDSKKKSAKEYKLFNIGKQSVLC